ncbi:MAG TPA: MFS transporter [Pseudonocardia sp.]|nr:MFS transporter [Pseudonocardia sp.]
MLGGRRGRIIAWGLWDWGSSAFNAVIGTFVFAVYLTGTVGADLPGPVSANSWLGYTLGAAGLLVALLAPVIGQRADATGRRRRSVGIWTALVVACTAAMFGVQDDHRWFALGLVLLGLGSICFELASVPYNALLLGVSTPATIGRVSGFGWAMGYLGGIFLLLLVYAGFIAGDGGLAGLPTENGLNIRVVALVAAGWFALFALPLFRWVPEPPRATDRAARSGGLLAGYRTLLGDIRTLYRRAPHTVYFLAASALYRDGVAAIFAFGGVLAVTVYGIDAADVLIFGVVANVTAAAGALVAGWFDDRVGPKAVIIGSLLGMLIAGTVLLGVSGPVAFWIAGLALTLFVGPAQASSRTFLARLAPAGHEGQLFGLYATTGRAVSFLAPTLVGLCTQLFGADRAGIAGILIVLGAGLIALWPVRPPVTERASAARGTA